MSKKIIPLIMSVLFMLMFTTNVQANEIKNDNVRVYVDDQQILFDTSSGKPYINKDNRTMMPFRKVAEATRAEVSWIGSANKAVAVKNGKTVEMTVGRKEYLVNSKKTTMDTEMVLQATEGRTYAPFRAISEGLGYEVDYTRVVPQGSNTEVLVVFNFTQGQNKAEQQRCKEKVINELQSKTPNHVSTPLALRYQGEMTNGKPNGAGKLYSGQEVVYEGKFADGVANGGGVLYKNKQVHFSGTFVKGEPANGQVYNSDGTKLFDGSISFWNDEGFRGEGGFYQENKLVYKGEITIIGGGVAFGSQGTLYYDTGEIFYQGDFYGDVPFGNGTFYAKDSTVLFEGSF